MLSAKRKLGMQMSGTFDKFIMSYIHCYILSKILYVMCLTLELNDVLGSGDRHQSSTSNTW